MPYKSRDDRLKYYYRHRTEILEKQKKDYHENKEERKQKNKENYEKHKEARRAYNAEYRRRVNYNSRAAWLKSLYGLSEDGFNLLLKAQENKCAICGLEFDFKTKNTTPHIDHDHATGKIRGLLCSEHNLALGKFKDSSKLLRAAARYLESGTKFLKPEPVTIEYDPNKKDCVVFDLDGTLAIIGDRSPYAQDKYHLDSPNKPVIDILHTYQEKGYTIILCTGREGTASVLKQTNDWLVHNAITYDILLSRKEGDFREDGIIKTELYKENIEPHFNVLFWCDDRDRVVQAIRGLGIPVLQVNEGNF